MVSFLLKTTVLFLILYFPRMLAWFASLFPQRHLLNSKNNKIAVIIPARNEGTAILPLLESLGKQTYNRKHFDIYIGVKEYDDPVITYGHNAGAEVFVIPNQKCKGDCLDACIKSILAANMQYDGYMIIDADCIIEENFMEEMNNAMASGAKVINAKKVVANYTYNNGKDSNLITACNGLIWTFMDEMGNRFKSDHGITTMTVTTGILFTADLVESWGGWIYRQTMTEDMELQRDCAVKGYKTYYTSYAKLYMQESPSLEETNKRRSRWMTGLVHSDFIYGRKMFQKSGFLAILNNYFIFCLWLVYAFVGVNALCVCTNLAKVIFNVVFRDDFVTEYVRVACYAFGNIYFAFFVLTFFALVVCHKDMKLTFQKGVAVLVLHPLFYMEYIPIVFKAMLIRKEGSWEEIKRVSSNVERESTKR